MGFDRCTRVMLALPMGAIDGFPFLRITAEMCESNAAQQLTVCNIAAGGPECG